MPLDILRYPDPRLRQSALPVTVFDRALAARVEAMFLAMAEARGVGLAAPQVGWNVRLFIANCADQQTREHERVFINPELLDPEGAAVEPEGCLSFPGISVEVPRAATITIRSRDLAGAGQTDTLTGLWARCVQHEYDHLEGRLLVDRMSPADRMTHKKTLQLWEKEHRARTRRRGRSPARS